MYLDINYDEKTDKFIKLETKEPAISLEMYIVLKLDGKLRYIDLTWDDAQVR
nr:hypothetical protein [Mycoplasmopsis bovis]